MTGICFKKTFNILGLETGLKIPPGRTLTEMEYFKNIQNIVGKRLGGQIRFMMGPAGYYFARPSSDMSARYSPGFAGGSLDCGTAGFYSEPIRILALIRY